MNDSLKRNYAQNLGLRDFLALGITGISVLGVITLAFVVIWRTTDTQQVNTIFTAVLPLLGSWVGTVLAYYFSKDNFETANRSLSDMVDKIGPQEKLKSVTVLEKMIAKNKIFCKKNSEVAQTKLVDILQKFNESNEVWSRLPILDDQDRPARIIHRTLIDKYLVDKLWNADPAGPAMSFDQFTLQDLLQDPKFVQYLDANFATVSESSTLADVKALMDSISECKDVFITKNGTKDEPILGWITNAIIIENAKI